MMKGLSLRKDQHIGWFSTAVNKLCPQPHWEGKGLFPITALHEGKSRQDLRTGTRGEDLNQRLDQLQQIYI